jgi:putative hemolysin
MSTSKSILESELQLGLTHSGNLGRTIGRFASFSLDRLLLLNIIRKHYNGIASSEDAFSFAHNALDFLRIHYQSCDGSLEIVPPSGPTIVVANHPFGGVDGLILIAMLSKVRTDIRILANYYLGEVPELRPNLLMVDPFRKKGSTQKNIQPIRKAVHWLKNGGMLITFPAGEVSHMILRKRRIEDPPWDKTIGRLIHITKVPVLPICFRGTNSVAFQVAGLIHPVLRTLMLPRELLKKRNSTIHVKIGKPIPYKKIRERQEPSKLMAYLRFRTYLLGKSFSRPPEIRSIQTKNRCFNGEPESIIPAVDKDFLMMEISKLPPEQKIAQIGSQYVCYARAHQIPWVLREIGRLREISFRETGEGTGKAVDLDQFDQTYIHLFLWNPEKEEIMGAYRLGEADLILQEHGKDGLYSHTLFNYGNRLLKEINPALEMGRTFIRKEYQKSYNALLLLWRGIGEYVVRHPQYKILFGAVSISNDYHSYSRDLMVAFLKMNHFLPHLSMMVKPRKPYKKRQRIFKTDTIYVHEGNLDEISSWISGIENDGKGFPILLKQYLKMGGKILCFNIDPDFGDALDGLIMVDLTETESKVLKRYMHEEGLKRFYDHHCMEKRDQRSLFLKVQ